jgi:hypothetical protein
LKKKTREDFQNQQTEQALRDLNNAAADGSAFGNMAGGSQANIQDKADKLRAKGDHYEPKVAEVEPKHWLIVAGALVALIVAARFFFY